MNGLFQEVCAIPDWSAVDEEEDPTNSRGPRSGMNSKESVDYISQVKYITYQENGDKMKRSAIQF